MESSWRKASQTGVVLSSTSPVQRGDSVRVPNRYLLWKALPLCPRPVLRVVDVGEYANPWSHYRGVANENIRSAASCTAAAGHLWLVGQGCLLAQFHFIDVLSCGTTRDMSQEF